MNRVISFLPNDPSMSRQINSVTHKKPSDQALRIPAKNCQNVPSYAALPQMRFQANPSYVIILPFAI